jgi:hypothetical protein
MADYLGWAATAVFVGSYFCQSPDTTRRVQMMGAAMWMTYGALMHAAPVFVANLLVLFAAAWTASAPDVLRRLRRRSRARYERHTRPV